MILMRFACSTLSIHEFGVDESANPDLESIGFAKPDVGEGISKVWGFRNYTHSLR